MARKICTCCNTRTAYTGGGDDPAPRSSDMCNPCYTEGGHENAHNDEGHDADTAPVAGCWICHPELNLAQRTATPRTGHTNTATTGPHRSHAACGHAVTPKARAACRATHTWSDDEGRWVANA